VRIRNMFAPIGKVVHTYPASLFFIIGYIHI
jgi:hypothetical protein